MSRLPRLPRLDQECSKIRSLKTPCLKLHVLLRFQNSLALSYIRYGDWPLVFVRTLLKLLSALLLCNRL